MATAYDIQGTSYELKKEAPAVGRFNGFHHVHFYVANAKQVADWYVLRLGFKKIAYRGLETGSRAVATHVVAQNKILFAFSSPLNPSETDMGRRIMIKGDAAKDVAFVVDDARGVFDKAVSRGATVVMKPIEESDEHGTVIRATVQTYGDTVHTFVQNKDYKGAFLPGYKTVTEEDPLAKLATPTGLDFIDHVVGNQPDAMMTPVADWYEKMLDFQRFWSVDDKMMHTKYSALRSVVMTDFDQTIKMPINEPADGLKKSQIQEYVDYHGEGGVQHIALNTQNIIAAVRALRSRGVVFLDIPAKYYDDLRQRLSRSKVQVTEDIAILAELGILVDFDDEGYLLQLFTKPVEDRPTLFYEIIQRCNHSGFGAGNFKALFESIERDQESRGNL